MYIILMFMGFGTAASFQNHSIIYSAPFYAVSLTFILVFYDGLPAYMASAVMYLVQVAIAYNNKAILRMHDILLLVGIPVFIFIVAYIAKMIKDVLLKVITELDVVSEQAVVSAITKKHFVSTINHEFRTPMNGILIAVQKLDEIQNLPEHAQKYHKIIQTCSATLLELINNVLDFSKLEEKKLELREHPTDIIKLFNDVVESFQLQYENSDVQIKLIMPSVKSMMVSCDPAKLRQILMNLVGNSFKFTRQGEVIIRLDVVSVENESCNFEILVQDTGIGIKSEDIPVIFHNFKQLDSSSQRQYQGVGLGLAIVHGLVQLMKGQIEVKSELNKGTSFKLRLCFGLVPQTTTIQENSYLKSKPDFSTKKILLVEDNSLNMELLVDMLTDFGFQNIDQAVNGKLGIEKCQTKKYDLILMDMQMPVLDGARATEQIRQNPLYSLNQNTLIYMVSANSSFSDQQSFLKAGCDGFIAKPVDIDQMEEKLTEIFRKSH